MNEELSELSYEEFVRARKLHWQEETEKCRADALFRQKTTQPSMRRMPAISCCTRPARKVFSPCLRILAKPAGFIFTVRNSKKILKCADIYNRANVVVDEDVVDIGWAVDGSACGLAVWGEFRAFLGVSNDLEMRKPVMNAEEDGIPASEWPAGFDRYLEPKID